MTYTAWSADGLSVVVLDEVHPNQLVGCEDDAPRSMGGRHRYARWTPAKDAELLAMRDRKMSAREMSRAIGRSTCSISQRLYELTKQQTAHPQCAGGVEQKGPSLPATCSAPSPFHSGTLPETLEPSKAAAPIFSVGDRLQLIADGE